MRNFYIASPEINQLYPIIKQKKDIPYGIS
jgi:hypothetical protein